MKRNQFKILSNDLANAYDWNCPKVTKRRKGDTQRIHKRARRKLALQDKEEIKQLLKWKEMYVNERLEK